MTTVLVTGGAGFIGSRIVDAALDSGLSVRVLDSLRTDVHERGYVNADVEFVEADLRDRDAVDAALSGIDVVCHQAAKVGVCADFSDAPDYVGSNDLATSVLLAAMAESKVERLVVASSIVVYGEGLYRDAMGRTVRPAARLVVDLDSGRFDPVDEQGELLTPGLITEEAPLDPRNVYAITKLTQEYLASTWARTTGGHSVALRYHNVYGPGMPTDTPYAGVASQFRAALELGEAPRMFEDGGQRRDFVHVRDVASANIAALEWTARQANSTFRAFNVGSGAVHTVGDLARQLSNDAGGPEPISTGEYRLGDVRHITASSERLRRELGWMPSVTFEDGMREFATAPLRAAVG